MHDLARFLGNLVGLIQPSLDAVNVFDRVGDHRTAAIQRSHEDSVLMIHVCLGTKAQLIKMAPVIAALSRRDAPYRLVDFGQHAAITPALMDEFEISAPVQRGDFARNVETPFEMVKWLARLMAPDLVLGSRARNRWFDGDSAGICVVHGDTPSAFVGAVLARRAGLRVAHVEAGLTSGSLLRPFPEEAIRQAVSRLSTLHFPPTRQDAAYLAARRRRGRIVFTHGNTGYDAVRAHASSRFTQERLPFALVSVHRVETILRPQRLASVLEAIEVVTRELPVLFVVHPPTRQRLVGNTHYEFMVGSGRIMPIDLLPHAVFTGLIRDAEFVMSDGGSVQEEAGYFDTPCLVLRSETERPLSPSAMLWGFSDAVLRDFLDSRESIRRPTSLEGPSPSKIVADVLIEEARVSPATRMAA